MTVAFIFFVAYINCSAVKPFKPVADDFFCFMPAVIMSKTSRHCVSNSATSRNKDALHVLSHRICKYSCAGKIYLHIYIPRVSSD